MSSQSVSADPRRPFWRPRFSLRALLIGMTLLCLVFAPVLPELNRARNVAQQVKIIEEMGGECVFVDRPQSTWASLVQRLWPVQIAHLEHDLLMAEFNAQTVDLAKLRGAPDVRGVCFNECQFVLPEDEPDVRLPRIEYVQLQERDDVKRGKPDPKILQRFPAFFPNLRKAQLMGVPQEQEFIDALAACERLEDLDLWFRYGESEVVNTALLGLLGNMRRLRLSGTCSTWNWAYLARLEKLEEIELGNNQQPILGYDSSKLTTAENISRPSYALTQLKSLRIVTLHESGNWDEQLMQIAQNNDLESVLLPSDWPATRTLTALRRENLRRLAGVSVNEDPNQVFQALRRFTQLRELEIHFAALTDENLRRLSELKSLERIDLSFDAESGEVTSAGIEVFRKLPIKDVRVSQSLSAFLLAPGMQRLIDSWPGPHPGRPFRQTDEGKQFLLRETQE